jgi:AsmA protein
MKRLRTLIAILALPPAALALLFLTASQVDLESVKREAESQLRNTLGLTVRFTGDFRFSYYPYFGFKTGQVSLHVPGNWDSPFLEIAELAARLELAPLLRGRMVIGKVVANGLVLNLERHPVGVANWDAALTAMQKDGAGPTASVPTAEGAANTAAPHAILEVSKLLVQDATVRLRDRPHNLQLDIQGLRLEMGRIWDNHPITFKSTFRFAGRQPQVRGEAKLAGQFRLDLANANFILTGLALRLAAEGPAIPVPHGTAQLIALASYDHATAYLALRELSLITEAVRADGEITARNLTSFRQYQGQIRVAMPDLPALLAGRPPGSSDANQAAVSATFAASPEHLRVDNLRLALGGATLAGNLEASAGNRPRVRVDLQGGHLDLRPLLASLRSAALATYAPTGRVDGPRGASASFPRPGSSTDGEAVLTAVRGFLAKGQLEGRLALEGLSLPLGQLMGVEVHLQGADGHAQGRIAVDRVADGVARLDVLLTVSEDAPGVRATLGGRLSGLNIARLGLSPYPLEGQLSLKFLLSAEGRTREELAHTVAGRLTVTGHDLAGLDPPALGAELPPFTPRVADLNLRLTPHRDPQGRLYHRVLAAGRVADPTAARAAAVQVQAPMALDPNKAGIPKIGPLHVQAVALNGIADSTPQLLEVRATNRLDLAGSHVDLERTEITINGQSVRLSGRLLDALGAAPSLHGRLEAHRVNPRPIVSFLGSKLPPTDDPQALTSLTVQMPFVLRKTGVRSDGLQIQLDDTTLEGRVALADGEAASLDFDLTGDAIDLNRYLPPQLRLPESSGNAPPESLRRRPDAPEGARRFNFAPLRTLHLDGKLRFGRIGWQGQEATDLSVAMRSRLGRLTVEPFRAGLFGGKTEGSFVGSFTADEARFFADLRLTDLDMEQIQTVVGESSTTVRGRLDVHFKGNARGTTTDRFKQTLSGRLGVKLKDAVIHWSAQDGQRKRDIPVNRAVARFQIRAGEFLNNDLVMASDRITVRGRGRFNLARDTVDYALTATYGDTVTTPIIVRGRLSDPKMAVEVAEALGGTSRNILDLPYRLLDPLVVPRLR